MIIGNLKLNKKHIIAVAFLTLAASAYIGYSYINSDLNYSANITARKQCSQTNLYDRLSCMATIDSISSKYVTSNEGVSFTDISSDTNGKGLYTLSSSLGEQNPINYYRGAVDNNNLVFSGTCWKIVRTTETGGIKLIYNGEPTLEGYCTNTTGVNTQLLSTSAFQTTATSPAYNGYMYGDTYTYQVGTLDALYYYGDSFTFTDVDPAVSGDGSYTLSNPVHDITEESISTNHYTCFNDTGECSSINYIYYISGTDAYYITLEDGKDIETALTEMRQNTTSSVIKTAIDTWFDTNIKTPLENESKDYEDYLEDTIWCNDRSFISDESPKTFEASGWNYDGGLGPNLFYHTTKRLEDQTPSLICSNKNDSFTVEESATGNGALTYPVGLLTNDETILAGGSTTGNATFYLNTNQEWWTMSPAAFAMDTTNNTYSAVNFSVGSTGLPNNGIVSDQKGVRPSISLKKTINITGGDGSQNTPYTVE